MICNKRKPNAAKIIFILYCLILIWIVLFKMSFSFSEIPWFSRTRRLNLIPFYYYIEAGNFHIKEIAMNVLVFIPMGLYLKILDISGAKAVLTGFIFSFSLEVIQFVTTIGASDITDIITNTTGTAIGVCSYLLARKIFADKAKIAGVINILASIVIVLFLSLAGILFMANR